MAQSTFFRSNSDVIDDKETRIGVNKQQTGINEESSSSSFESSNSVKSNDLTNSVNI